MPPAVNIALDILLTVAMLAVMLVVYRRGRTSQRLRGQRKIEDDE